MNYKNFLKISLVVITIGAFVFLLFNKFIHHLSSNRKTNSMVNQTNSNNSSKNINKKIKNGFISIDLDKKKTQIGFYNIGFTKPIIKNFCNSKITIQKITKEFIFFELLSLKSEDCQIILAEKEISISIRLEIFYQKIETAKCDSDVYGDQTVFGYIDKRHLETAIKFKNNNSFAPTTLLFPAIVNYYDIRSNINSISFDSKINNIVVFYGKNVYYNLEKGFNTKFISTTFPKKLGKNSSFGLIIFRDELNTKGNQNSQFYVKNQILSYRKLIKFNNETQNNCAILVEQYIN